MYEIAFDPSFLILLDKLKVKDPKGYNNAISKIQKIAINFEYNPNHCKNLRAPLQDYKRVHVNKSFIIIFKVDIKNKLLIVYDYDHHKRIYKKSYHK